MMLEFIVNWLQDVFDKDNILPMSINTDNVRCLDYNMDEVVLLHRKQQQNINLSLIMPERINDNIGLEIV